MSKEYLKYSDSELYTLLAAGHDSNGLAFRELYNRYSKKIYLYCRKILSDNATSDDVFQETFIRFIKYATPEKQVENVGSYLFRIARNLCFDSKRSKPMVTVPFEEFQFPVADEEFMKAEINDLLNAALEILGDNQREAFVLQMYGGFNYAEIAEMLNVPVSTVKNWLIRAKVKLRQVLLPFYENQNKL